MASSTPTAARLSAGVGAGASMLHDSGGSPDKGSAAAEQLSDGFEEITDPSDILLRPLVRHDQSATLSRGPPSSSARQLPWKLGGSSSSATSTATSARPVLWKQSKPGYNTTKPSSKTQVQQMWDPSRGKMVPVISGGSARLPSRLLGSGAALDGRQGRLTSTSTAKLLEESALAAASHSPSAATKDGSIDLTADDSDDEPIVTGSSTSATPRSARPSAEVCIGQLNVMIQCNDGLPDHMTYDDPARLPEPDPAYARSNWPRPNDFWCSRTHRPVGLEITYGSSATHPGARLQAEVLIKSLLAPTVGPRGPIGPRFDAKPFGSLASKAMDCLAPLMGQGKITVAGRCRMTQRSKKNYYMHPMELILFTTRSLAHSVGQTIASHNYHLVHPERYIPSDWENRAEYLNPHASSSVAVVQPQHKASVPPASQYHVPPPPVSSQWSSDALASTYASTSGYPSSYSYPSMRAQAQQQKELSEEEKRKQVDSVYASLRSGEDLEQVEPCGLIKTQLFPHQKQALGFLLERERERSFDELSASSEASVKSEFKVKGKAKASLDADSDASGTVSLWKVVRNSGRSQRTFFNVVTQTEVKDTPNICRGALLADDMGLGKTLQIISLIAHTQEEANSFGKSRIVRIAHQSDTSDDSDNDDSDVDEGAAVKLENFSRMMNGAPAAKKSKLIDAVIATKGGVRAAKRTDEERLRRENLVTRSRATLIIAPLSIITNWEEQIKEHWSRRNQPKIYVYHGPSRSMDCRKIANHDIVLTTYSTIGTEFANQRTWTSDGDSDGSVSDGDDEVMDDVEEIDENGNTVISFESRGASVAKAKAKAKAKRRREKFAKGKEAYNPLQRIEWFRVVLDEAHIIKEASTWQSRATVNLSAQRRISLTGTPIQNRLDDLFAQIKFLRLEPFTDRAVWTRYCGQRKTAGSLTSAAKARKSKGPSDEVLDAMALARVQLIMKFLTLRRTKNTRTADGKTLLSLPPKLMLITKLKLSEHEKAKYKAMHQRWKEEMEEMAANDTVSVNYATILHEILNLRLTCCHADLVDTGLDKKQLREGNENVAMSIRDHGLTRDRAINLFLLFCESDSANCSHCGAELSSIADLDGNFAASRAKGDIDDLLNGINDGDRQIKGLKKDARSRGSSAGSRTPLEADEKREAVITRCQHLFCSTCFTNAESIGPRWRKPTSKDEGACPTCRNQLRLALEVILLSVNDFRSECDAGPSEADMANNKPSPFADDGFDWDDVKDAKWTNGKGKEIDLSLEARPDMSTKIQALIKDLLPFSRCNPASKLYDPAAPRLEHTTELVMDGKQGLGVKDEDDVKRGKVKVEVMPSAVKSEGGQSAAEPRLKVLVTPTAATPSTDTRGFVLADATQVVKSVVFSQWTTMLDRIQRSLAMTGIGFTRLDGSMGRQERAVALERFKTEARVEVLLISLRAGGFGLNLVSACRAYLMDPYWNPAVENQALDRIHRWGQKKPVVMTKYVMRHTIEIAMLELQRRKMRLAETVGKRRALTAEEKKRERQEEYDLMMAETGEGVDSDEEDETQDVSGQEGQKGGGGQGAQQVVEVVDDDDDVMYMGMSGSGGELF